MNYHIIVPQNNLCHPKQQQIGYLVMFLFIACFDWKIGCKGLLYSKVFGTTDDSSWKNEAESFAVALTLTLGGYENATAPSV